MLALYTFNRNLPNQVRSIPTLHMTIIPTATTDSHQVEENHDGGFDDSIDKDMDNKDNDDDKEKELRVDFDLQDEDGIDLPHDHSTGDMFDTEEKADESEKEHDADDILKYDSPEKHSVDGRKGNDSGDNSSVDLPDDANVDVDPLIKEQQDLIKTSTPTTVLEIALSEELGRKQLHVDRLSGEIKKLKCFISKRKQTYKRKRKDEGAPTRALSAYNIFVQDRFSRLAKENEAALKSADSDAQLKRVPPASLVASTGNEWKALSTEERNYYEERAKADRKRYEDQMAKYQPPDKQANRKRNKTGYNMFFSAHVLQLKRSESGVPSERGSVARLVGNAWKELSPEDKQFYEREADKQNGMASDDELDEKDEDKRRTEYPPGPPGMVGMEGGHRPGMPPPMGHGPPVVHQPPHHDPRMHQYPPPGPHGPHYQYPAYYEYHQPPPPGQGQPRNQSNRGHNGYYHPNYYPDHQG